MACCNRPTAPLTGIVVLHGPLTPDVLAAFVQHPPHGSTLRVHDSGISPQVERAEELHLIAAPPSPAAAQAVLLALPHALHVLVTRPLSRSLRDLRFQTKREAALSELAALGSWLSHSAAHSSEFGRIPLPDIGRCMSLSPRGELLFAAICDSWGLPPEQRDGVANLRPRLPYNAVVVAPDGSQAAQQITSRLRACMKTLSGTDFAERLGEPVFCLGDELRYHEFKELQSYVERPASDGLTGSVRITKWAGRFGNMVVQLSNAIATAREKGIGTVSCPLESQSSVINLPRRGHIRLPFGDAPIVVESTFMWHTNIDAEDQRLITQEYIAPLLAVPTVAPVGITPKTAVCHVRGGDTFEGAGGYVLHQPAPASFFIKVIREQKFTDVVVVTEPDRRSPVLRRLRRTFPFLRIQSKDLSEDLNTLLSAGHLITGNSTFSQVVPLLSHSVQAWHFCDQWGDRNVYPRAKDYRLPFDVYVYNVPASYLPWGWHNEGYEREQVLTLPESSVVLVRTVPAGHSFWAWLLGSF